MSTSREIERLARTLIAQKTDRTYVIHYLSETYQLSMEESIAVVDKVAPPNKVKDAASKMAAPGTGSEGPKRTTFY